MANPLNLNRRHLLIEAVRAWNAPLGQEAQNLFSEERNHHATMLRHAQADLLDVMAAARRLHTRIVDADPEFVGDVRLWAEFSTLGEVIEQKERKVL